MPDLKNELRNTLTSKGRNPASTVAVGSELAAGAAVGVLFGGWLESFVPEAPPGSGAAFLTAVVPAAGHLIRNALDRKGM